MDAVRCIDDAFYGNNVTSRFPLLEEFTIEDMPNLEEISVGCEIETFPHLVGLTVVRCPKLKNLPHLPSIKRLQLEVNNWALLGLLANFTSLIYLYVGNFAEPESLEYGLSQNHIHFSHLSIHNFPALRYLSKDLNNLTALAIFKINDREKWESLPSLTSPHDMDISFCNGLTYLALRGLTSLQCLTIHLRQSVETLFGEMQHVSTLQGLDLIQCPQLTSLPQGMQQFINLQRLSIWSLEKLTSLPDGLQNTTTLQELQIANCSRLMELPEWLGNLKSLRYFFIWNCTSLASLPTGIQYSSELEYLSIVECPHLERRCQKEKGEDWHKIAHIRRIEIGRDVKDLLELNTKRSHNTLLPACWTHCRRLH